MKTILVVDAVRTNLICAVEILNEQYEVITAKSGNLALEHLKEKTPDLILLDVNLPQMDGFEVYEWLKAKPELAQVPVIFQTSENDKEKEEKGLEMGAADFVRKPYEPDDLLRRIEKVLLLQENSVKSEGFVNQASQEMPKASLMERCQRENDGYFVLLELNQFRQTKEVLGKLIGEEILDKTEQILREELEENSSICLLEDGRFAVFLAGENEREQVKTIVRRMIAGVEFEAGDLLPDEIGIKLSMSAGIARKPDDGCNYEELYDCADKALYFVKQSGKRGYYFYNTQQSENVKEVEEQEPVFVMPLKKLLSESKESREAACEQACQLLSHYLKNKNEKAQVLWLQLDNAKKDEEKTQAIGLLEKVIEGSLRRGDVALPCSGCCYMVVLLGATVESAKRVSERICNKWRTELPDTAMVLTGEIKSV